LFVLTSGSEQGNRSISEPLFVAFNGQYLQGLPRPVRLTNPKAVFDALLAAAPSPSTILPSENYFYFRFVCNGREYAGNLQLATYHRDKGRLSFSYAESDRVFFPDIEDRSTSVWLDSSDGVDIVMISEGVYEVSSGGHKVEFHIPPMTWPPIEPPALMPDDVLVAPCRDESGTEFFLLYSKGKKQFQWVLDEAGSNSPKMVSHESGVQFDPRTGFAFYYDRRLGRKTLIGVRHESIHMNDWFDGPFDQLPDDLIAVGKVQLYKWLVHAHKKIEGKVDKHGQFLDDKDSRIALTSYVEYESPKQFVTDMKRFLRTGKDPQKSISSFLEQRANHWR
jgi:hypothetical protein